MKLFKYYIYLYIVINLKWRQYLNSALLVRLSSKKEILKLFICDDLTQRITLVRVGSALNWDQVTGFGLKSPKDGDPTTSSKSYCETCCLKADCVGAVGNKSFFLFQLWYCQVLSETIQWKKKKKRHLVLKIDSVTLKWLFSKCFIWVLWNSNTCTYSSSCTVKFMNLTLLAPLVRTIVLHEQFLYHDMLWLYYGKKD